MHRISIPALALSVFTLLAGVAGAAENRPAVETLTEEADKIVLGTVGVRSSHWTGESRIYTEVVVTPDVTLKGEDSAPVLVQLPGGIIGDVRMEVSDSPELLHGERVLLFLKRSNNHFEVAGRDAGKYQALFPEAADAVERVLKHIEKATRKAEHARRAEAEAWLAGPRTAVIDPLTGTTTTTTTTTSTCYGASTWKWPNGAANYRLNASVPAAWAPSIAAAAATWTASGAAFSLTVNTASINELTMVDLVAKYGSTYSNTYALSIVWSNTTTNQITKAVIEIGTKWQWSTTAQANMADVQNILTHEFGHWLRLADIYSPSTCSETTMWGSAMLGETKKRTLEQPDINGIVSLYGRKGTIAAPVLVAPANGATGLATATLTWQAASGATSYNVYFGTSASPALVATVTGTTYAAGTLAKGVTYYWRIAAKNATGIATSATWSFTTASGGLTAPVLVSPANGSTAQPLTPTLKWNAVTGATSYEVYFGATSVPPLLGSTTATAVQISGLQPATTYYWKIVARSSTGAASSAVWSLRTQ